jgi:hypothetical protein
MTSPWKHPVDDSVKIVGSPCPACGQYLDGATVIEHRGATPKTGDLSVCLYCAAVNQFALGANGLVLTAVEGDELILAMAHPTVKRAVAAVRDLNAKGLPPKR